MGITAVAAALVKADEELRLFVLLAIGLLVAALITPVAVPPPYEQWPALFYMGVSERYWFIPMLAFVAALIWLAGRRGLVKILAVTALVIMSYGVIKDWRVSQWRQDPISASQFKAYSQYLDAVPKGARVTIDYQPNWSMTLIKR